MRAPFKIAHEFVEFIPRDMDEGTLYIAIEFATASHKCFCGCGAEVVTPISPVGWQILYDGETVSLTPSIGSWSLPCRSHYWIRRDRVEWSGSMSEEGIAVVRQRDAAAIQRHYGAPQKAAAVQVAPPAQQQVTEPAAVHKRSLLARVAEFLRGR